MVGHPGVWGPATQHSGDRLISIGGGGAMAKDTAKLRRRAEFLNLSWRLRFGRGDPIEVTREISGFVQRYGNEYSARAAAALSDALVRGTALAREGAAEALGWVGDRASAEPLITATKDEMPPVRAAALNALSRLDSRSFAAVFQRSLPDLDPRVRLAALTGLVAAGDPRYAEDVAPYLDDEATRRVAATGLQQWGWATDDRRRAQLAMARDEWTEIAELGAGSVAQVAQMIADDRYWGHHGLRNADRMQAIDALGQLLRRHATELGDADLRAVAAIQPFDFPIVDHSFDESRVRHRRVDLSELERLCAAELRRRNDAGWPPPDVDRSR